MVDIKKPGEDGFEKIESVPKEQGSPLSRASDFPEALAIKEAIGDAALKVEPGEATKLEPDLTEPKVRNSVQVSSADKALVTETATAIETKIDKHYEPGFGVSPSESGGNFDHQLWARDFSHAAGTHFAATHPEAAKDSLSTILRNQREDGALPYKTEQLYGMLQIIPGAGKFLAKNLFDLFEGKIKKRKERPVYEGQDLNGAEDTVPAVILATGDFFLASEMGREFVAENFDQLKKAMEFFRKKIDPEDSLVNVARYGPDWTESIKRKGKLGTINVWWARSLRVMQKMAKELGRTEDAEAFGAEYEKVKGNVMDKIYDKKEGYFRAKAGEDRLDTGACVFGAMYLLSPEEAVRVEENLSKRVKHSSGLVNFDPPYGNNEIQAIPRLAGNGGYHNEYVWPWLTCENIQVKIKIALKHPDEAVRERYKKEAVEDLINISKLFQEMGGAYETVKPDEPEPAVAKRLGLTVFTPAKNFMGSMAAYQSANRRLTELGWI